MALKRPLFWTLLAAVSVASVAGLAVLLKGRPCWDIMCVPVSQFENGEAKRTAHRFFEKFGPSQRIVAIAFDPFTMPFYGAAPETASGLKRWAYVPLFSAEFDGYEVQPKEGASLLSGRSIDDSVFAVSEDDFAVVETLAQEELALAAGERSLVKLEASKGGPSDAGQDFVWLVTVRTLGESKVVVIKADKRGAILEQAQK